jgi:hypothetical protein
MDEQLIKSGVHERFIRMLIDKNNDDKSSMMPKQPSNKTSMY